MTTHDIQRRLSDALVMLAPRLRERFRAYYTDLDGARLLSQDGTLALQWREGRVPDGIVEVLTLTANA